MKRLSGDELRAWARQKAYLHVQGPLMDSLPALEFLLIETYLQGAVDALKEEVDFLYERGSGVRQP